MQTRALHFLAIIPRNLHGVPHPIQFRVDLNTLTRSLSIHNRDKRSLRNDAQPLARCGYIYVTRTRPHGAPSKHTFATLPLRPVLLYIITLRCFPSHFLLFLFLFGRSCGRQNSSSGSIFSNASPLPACRPTNPFACRPHTHHRSAIQRHSASARFSRPVRTPSAMSAAAFAAELPLDDPPRLFRLPLFPQAVQGSAFLCVLVTCGTYVLSSIKTSTFIEVFARLCIFIHCILACFSPIRLLFPSLRSFPRCRSAAGEHASAPLRRFCFRAPLRRPAFRFRRRSFAFSFSAVVLPLFVFSISFCLMPHGAPQTFCLFFSAFGFSRFPFDDPLRIFLCI